MNAQPTATAKAPGRTWEADTRSSQDGSRGGFQALFAAASDGSPAEAGNGPAQATPGRIPLKAVAVGAGKKTTVASKSPDQSPATMNVMAAALGQSVPREPAIQSFGPSGGDPLGAGPASGVEDLGGASGLVSNAAISTTPFLGDTGTAGAPHIPLARVLLANDATAKDSTANLAATNPTQLPAELDASDTDGSPGATGSIAMSPPDGLSPGSTPAADIGATPASPAAAIATPAAMRDARGASSASGSGNAQKPAEPHAKALGKEVPVAAELNVAPPSPTPASAAGTPAVGADGMNSQAVGDLSVQSMAVGRSPVSQDSAEPEAAKVGGKGPAAVTADSGTPAALQPAFAISPGAADGSAGDKRGSWFAKSDEGEQSADELVTAGAQGASLAQTTAGASGHIIATAQDGARPAPSPPLDRSGGSTSLPPTADAAPPTPGVQTAQVLQRMDKAEIRIGLQSTDFGAIRLHASVTNDQVGASVSTAHAGLRDALFVEAPSLEKAMVRHNLRLDSVNVGGGAANANSNSFGSNERHPAPPGALGRTSWAADRQPGVQSPVTPTAGAGEGSYRLDVRA